MAKASVKTLTLVKSRDIVVDRLLKPCEEDNHSRCTGWAVLKKEISPIDVNYFLRCTCACHHHKKERSQQIRKKQVSRKQLKKRIKKKAKKKLKPRKTRKIKVSRKSKKSRKARRR